MNAIILFMKLLWSSIVSNNNNNAIFLVMGNCHASLLDDLTYSSIRNLSCYYVKRKMLRERTKIKEACEENTRRLTE